jgi:hypothetical protein
MKLSDLNPRWTVAAQWLEPGGVIRFNQDNFWGREGMGLSFDCPHCITQRIGVWFSNPIDGKSPISGVCLWKRERETFETLTLTPSINTTETKIDVEKHWHGFIKNGIVI